MGWQKALIQCNFCQPYYNGESKSVLRSEAFLSQRRIQLLSCVPVLKS